MEEVALSYREVVPDLQNQEKWNEITLNTGGTQSTLQDIKIPEKAGGFCYKIDSNNLTRNRFIYWRTYHDVLELSEINLDFNLYENNIRYRFPDSPVLSVNIIERKEYVIILVVTVSSLHRLVFSHPAILCENDLIETSKSFSIFRNNGGKRFYVIGQATSSNNPIPHAACSDLSSDGTIIYFGVAYQTHIMLFCMDWQTGQTISHTLKENHIMPRIFSNITGALRGKQVSTDSEYATSLVFNCIGDQTFLVALYRDDNLRLWTTNTIQCVCTLNCLRFGAELRSQGAQTNALRKVNETTVCAFVSHSMGSEFVNVKITWDGSSNYTMSRTKRISAPQSDLADFEVSENRIWALWYNAQGEFSISNFSLFPANGTGIKWISAATEPLPDRYCILVEQGVDPKQAYCSYIFHPGKFDKSVIIKALMMFRRSNIILDTNLPLHILKERVCQSVETEIQNEIKDFDVTDDEYVDICTRFWEKFYSCCEQYHLKACQPVGIVLLDTIEGVCIVKKNFFTLLRPCETLEHLMITGENTDNIDNFISLKFNINEKQSKDLSRLIVILSQMEQEIQDEIKLEIDNKLYQLEMPDSIIHELICGMSAIEYDREIFSKDFLALLKQSVQSITDIRAAIAILLENLRLDVGNSQELRTYTDLSKSTQSFLKIGNLFGGNIGISVLSETVRQIAHIRYSLSIKLLILQQLLIEVFATNTIEVLETIQSQFMPQTVVLVQSYYSMVWVCETPINLHQMVSLDGAVQRLQLLHLTDGRPIFNCGQNDSVSLLRIFLNSKGLYTALTLFYEKLETVTLPWHSTLLPVANIITKLIWAVSGNFIFGEWLFESCLHIVIQEYVRLLNSWCEWNNCSRQFILAVSLLDTGETNKAYDLFLQSAKGVQNEHFLKEKILKSNTSSSDVDDEEISSPDELMIQYYLKVIQLFEQHNALDNIISIAQAAVGILSKQDPQLPMFQSIIFNNHLILEHYEEAYHSLIYNADLSRRKDCLRQLVVCLFGKKRLDLLMHFPYTGLQDEFESIVESRARSMSVENNELYDFLYAFHISKDNMRKASSIQYEYAMRLQLESDSLDSMDKRYDCLLACINCLHLIDKRFQWIAKPVVNDETIIAPMNSMDIENDAAVKEQVVVIEISDVRKELLQCEAFLCLARHRRDISSFLNVGPEELVMILANSGLYTSALKLATGFKINLVPIFESLTSACVRTVDESSSDTLAWLQENDLADLPHKSTASEMAWLLLQKLIEEYEDTSSTTTTIRKGVVNKILKLNAFIPQWLYLSYKVSNASELLRLFIKHDRFLEAADLAKEYIWAMLGLGKEYFGLKNALIPTAPAMCFPLNSIDMLLYGLKLNSEDDVENYIEYKQALIELEDLVQNYIETSARVSEEMIKFQRQKFLESSVLN